jgi:hypothetical protein
LDQEASNDRKHEQRNEQIQSDAAEFQKQVDDMKEIQDVLVQDDFDMRFEEKGKDSKSFPTWWLGE